MSISGNLVGSYSQIGKTFILEDSDGNEFTGVITENVVIFDADPQTDIREGKMAVTDMGIVTGEAFIPNYVTYTGTTVIANGKPFTLSIKDNYNYTKLQAIICNYNTNLTDSVGAEKVVLDDQVFEVKSTTALSSVVKDSEKNLIDFGITNTSGKMCLIRYFMYKELY